jgi:hypothetical protein
MGWKALAAIGLLLAVPVHADEYSAKQAWLECVLSKAVQYAKGHDAATVVVSGALAACFEQQKEYLAAIGRQPPGAAVEIAQTIRKEFSEAALVVILEKRAAP